MGVDYTNGWDVCIATSFDNVSKLLAYAYDRNVTPHQGSGQFSVPLGPVTVTAQVTDATVGAWSMAGGTGQNVVISIPFTGGSAQIGTKTYVLSGDVLQVTVLLRFVKSTVGGGGAEYQLNINLTDPSAIVAVNLLNTPPNLTADEKSALTITLQNLLESSLAGSGVTVATVNLSQYAATYPWLVPTGGVDYAAATDSSAAGGGTLALLLATINPVPGTPPTLQSGTIPSGSNGALIISNQIFTQQFLAPAFASSINVPTSQLSYGGRNPMVISGSGSASGASVSGQASAKNGQVALALNGSKSPMSGVSVDFTINAAYAVALGGTAQNPVLSFTRTSQSENHSTDIAWWVYLASGLSGGAIGLMVVAMIQAIVNSTAGSSLSSALPAGFASTIAWPFSGTVNLNQAFLPLPLQLGGNVTE